MNKLGWDYPLHLGVTEAGGGADGRIKSATGIGALLIDGLGDTVRVSLTEDPEYEAKPCISLRRVAERALGKGVEPFEELSGRGKGRFERRACDFAPDIPLNTDGSVLSVTTAEELRSLSTSGLCNRLGLKLRKDGQPQKDLKSIDAIVIDSPLPEDLSEKVKFLLDMPVGILCRDGAQAPDGCTLLVDASDVEAPLPQRLGGYALICNGEEPPEVLQAALEKVSPRCILLRPRSQDGVTFLCRRFFARLIALEAGKSVPAMLWFSYPENEDEDDAVISASADFGSLFIDGLGEGILWDTPSMTADALREAAFNLLQAARMRISKTEFISCPSCGRTLFDLQQTTAAIQERTGHLPGVRIAVMGCIVNGPGEMADADFGYVGSGAGKVDLYVNYARVKRGIASEDAVDALVELIKEHGRWQDPPDPEEDEQEFELAGAVAAF